MRTVINYPIDQTSDYIKATTVFHNRKSFQCLSLDNIDPKKVKILL